MVVTATGDRRAPASRVELLFLVTHAGVFPLLGAALAVAAYTYTARGILPWPGAVLDAIAVICGAVGLLAGGVAGFAIADQRKSLAAIAWPRLAIRVGLSEAAVLGSLAFAGVPPTGATLWMATMVAVIVGVVVGTRGLKQRSAEG